MQHGILSVTYTSSLIMWLRVRFRETTPWESCFCKRNSLTKQYNLVGARLGSKRLVLYDALVPNPRTSAGAKSCAYGKEMTAFPKPHSGTLGPYLGTHM